VEPRRRSLRSIPDYLEPFIVDQEMGRYSAIDQAVWRFVLLQLHARLEHTAHPSYVRGLAESGISAARIPSIEEMNHKLSAIGWSAVCVDGFLPPRAFTAFQALGVLPIAAEIRTPDHLPYTPAPDIIHEAAGHAPILIDPRYAAYVKASGDVAERAFANPADARVDRAVRLLSDLKDARDSSPPDLAASERELSEAIGSLGPPSEAARLARLYWWTAEYGLVGTPTDYRLYGAGLLSSLGESHFCHAPSVLKHPLSAACVDVGFDITRPQPQLFVARDFEHLHQVLAEVKQTLAHTRGGMLAARAALASQETCTVELEGGSALIGTLLELSNGDGCTGLWLRFAPGAALLDAGRLCARFEGSLLGLLGPLADGKTPRELLSRQAAVSAGRSCSLSLEYASGARLRGTWPQPGEPEGSPWVWLEAVSIERPAQPPVRVPGRYPLLLSPRLLSARAGSSCPEVSPLASTPARVPGTERLRVPKLRSASRRHAELERLYSATEQLRSAPPPQRAGRIAALREQLDAQLPHEWLLRWNLLECLNELGRTDSPLARSLRARLWELEEYYEGQHPIALGLEYLSHSA
jgi:phenylalanine-4-hydroxylase